MVVVLADVVVTSASVKFPGCVVFVALDGGILGVLAHPASGWMVLEINELEIL